MGIGIILIGYVMLQYGVPLLANASFILSGNSKDDVVANKKNETVFVDVPVFDSIVDATNTATISVRGSSKKDTTVNLYVNDELVDKIDTDSDGSFEFKRVTLEEGKNSLKANVTENNKDSEFTEEITVSYLKKAPEITLDSPSDGQEYKGDEKTAQVKGKTDPDVKVTVNDAWAIIDGDGNFSYNLPLHDGENVIKIVGIDPAGNKTEMEQKIKYSP